jgi:hypothetical protein
VLRPALGWLVAGVVAGVLWRVLTPLAAGWSESYETDLAGDLTLAGLEVVAGVLAGLLGLASSGRGAAQRFVVAVLGAAAASGVAWGAGRLISAPRLLMPAVLLLWPLTVALVTVVATLVATLVLRDPYDETPSETGRGTVRDRWFRFGK